MGSEEFGAEGVEGGAGGGELGEDVEAVAVGGDHFLQAGDLAGDAVEAAGEGGGVVGHMGRPFMGYGIPLGGIRQVRGIQSDKW